MFNIGETIYQTFGSLGTAGMLLCIFLLFYIDAIVFPTLPELFTIIIFMAIPEPWFAGLILITIAVAELAGLTTLYTVVNNINVPERISSAVNKYRRFLLLSDERMIIVNRFAPMLPFIGAFVAICGWSFRKAALYTLVSGMVKFGTILAMANLFYVFFSGSMAEIFTIVMVLIVLVISLAVSTVRRRRMGAVTCE
ncbi:MAG: hypothetical protein ACLFUV_03475 [Methanomassiliicoccales archaeon]